MGWSGAAFSARQGTQLLALVLLARFLPPEDFGLMAMAAVVTGLALVVRDLGTGAAVIREPQLGPSMLATLFWAATSAGVLLALMVIATAPLAARAFAEPRLEGILQALAAALAVGGLGVVPQSLLERSLRFRAIALAEICAGAISLCVGIVAAVAGMGVASLVLFSVVQVAVLTLVVAFAARWAPQARPDRTSLRTISRFGGPLVGYSLLNYLVRNGDNAMIGRFLGSGALGFYAIAYRLMMFPVQVVNAVANRVLFPVLARLASRPAEMRTAYLDAVTLSALIALPIAAGLAGASDQVIRVLFGTGWEPAIPVLRLLALVAVAQVLGATIGPVFLATGRTDRLLLWGLLSALVTLVAFGIGLQFGIVGVAAAYAVASLGLFLPSLWVGLSLIDLPVRVMVRRLAPEVGAAALVGIASFAVGSALATEAAGVVLCIQIAVCVPLYLAAVHLADPRALADAASSVKAAVGTR